MITLSSNRRSSSCNVARLYKAVMPVPVIPLLAPRAQVIPELAKAVCADKDPVNITEGMAAISGVLDRAIVAEAHIEPGAAATTIPLKKPRHPSDAAVGETFDQWPPEVPLSQVP
ncbi:hypothetical protein HQ447_10325 [bacterium]|nr:hypothetical protein [bacterium]